MEKINELKRMFNEKNEEAKKGIEALKTSIKENNKKIKELDKIAEKMNNIIFNETTEENVAVLV